MAKHAFLSASGAPYWMLCEAKPWREKDLPEKTSAFAEEGILAHRLLEKTLKSMQENKCIETSQEEFPKEMFYEVAKTIELVKDELEFLGQGILLSEEKLDISFITGEEGATGTLDVGILKPKELAIIDLKYGMGVEVEAINNEQLAIYGAAAIEKYDLLGEVKKIKLIISQPRLNRVSIWKLTVEELNEFIEEIRTKAQRILASKGGDLLVATPGDKQCQFCKAKLGCPEYNDKVAATIAYDFVDLTKTEDARTDIEKSKEHTFYATDETLANAMEVVDLVEDWCKTVRSEVNRRLMMGDFTDKRYKLVRGKKGNRKWVDEAEVARVLKKNEINPNTFYKTNLDSPSQIEKELKKHPVWELLKENIYQEEAKPTVAKASDPRPAIEDEIVFENIEGQEFTDSLLGLTKDE